MRAILGGSLNPKRSLVSLVTFCASSGLVVALGIAVLIATVTAGAAVIGTLRSSGSNVVLASTPTSMPNQMADLETKTQDPVTVAGLVTDNHCGARHDRGSGMSAADCARMCVRSGASYSLVTGDRKYALAEHTEELARLAGQRVTISGSIVGDTIKVSSITN
jgi:hypothetical protein